MTNKEIQLIDKLNYENREWQIMPAVEIETELFFGAKRNEIIEGPIIYCYIEKDMERVYEKIAKETIGYENFKIIDIDIKDPIYTIAVYIIKETDE